MIRAGDAQPGWSLQTNNIYSCDLENLQWHGKKRIEIIKSDENQLVQAGRDRNTVRTYVNTPATAEPDIAE